MADPFDAQTSFQQALLNGEISLRVGELDPDLFLHVDHPTGGLPRFTYVRLDRQSVTALAMMVPDWAHARPSMLPGGRRSP